MTNQSHTDLSNDEKLRLAMAARIAAGMCANPECMRMRDYQGEIAMASWGVAGRLILLAKSGGC